MQLYVIDWKFENAEDQIFATNEFCEYLKNNKINSLSEDMELITMGHTPQDGSGVIFCRAKSATIIFNLLKMWRENYSISFNIKPALTNEELIELNSSEDFWKGK